MVNVETKKASPQQKVEIVRGEVRLLDQPPEAFRGPNTVKIGEGNIVPRPASPRR